jgi:hypothetical protein
LLDLPLYRDGVLFALNFARKRGLREQTVAVARASPFHSRCFFSSRVRTLTECPSRVTIFSWRRVVAREAGCLCRSTCRGFAGIERTTRAGWSAVDAAAPRPPRSGAGTGPHFDFILVPETVTGVR